MHIKKGDHVKILTGKDAGKTGAVLRVFPMADRVSLEGLNLFKKRTKPRKQGQKGEVVDIPKPMHVSNVALVCKSCKKPTRVGFRMNGAAKARICKKCSVAL